MKRSAKLILMRHGQSVWNAQNLFTGWVDVPLTEKGIDEAVNGGKKIQNIPIDVIYTSSLARAQQTAYLAMTKHKSGLVPVMQHPENRKLNLWSKIFSKKTKEETIPMYASWHLNERMYGKLQGLDKDETRKKYGKEQVHIWRRSFDIAPPEGESLKDTAKRTLPYFHKKIVPELKKGKNVFVSAHGNSLRAIIMYLDSLSKDEVVHLEIATGDPILYVFEKNQFIKQ